ncbi:MAG: hypothetical protein ACO1TE_00535 [Prosthecobacter sp.]
MSVSETVQLLAKAIGGARGGLSPRHRLLLGLLQLMPLYGDVGDLGAWDLACQEALSNGEDDSETAQLLKEVFEFGRFNMYSRFDPQGTSGRYAVVSTLLQQAGIACPQVDEFTGL